MIHLKEYFDTLIEWDVHVPSCFLFLFKEVVMSNLLVAREQWIQFQGKNPFPHVDQSIFEKKSASEYLPIHRDISVHNSICVPFNTPINCNSFHK